MEMFTNVIPISYTFRVMCGRTIQLTDRRKDGTNDQKYTYIAPTTRKVEAYTKFRKNEDVIEN